MEVDEVRSCTGDQSVLMVMQTVMTQHTVALTICISSGIPTPQPIIHFLDGPLYRISTTPTVDYLPL